jgi:catalase
VASLTQAEAEKVQAKDLGSASKDLFTAIEKGDFPQWDLFVQVMEDHDHPELDWDPLDDTKIWPEDMYGTDLAPGQNPHVNFEPSIHNGLQEAVRKPNNPPEIRGQLTASVIERRNDYVQPRARYCTMMDWERDDLVNNLATLLAQCERDVQERMLWHLSLIHDDYGQRVGQALGITADDVRHLEPLAGQALTAEDRARREKLGHNGDRIDAAAWGKWTSSVPNYQARAEEVLNGMPSLGRKAAAVGR